MTRVDRPNLDRSLADKAYDFLGDILLQAETEELLMEIEQEKSNGDTAEMDAFFALQDHHNIKQIQRYFRKQGYKRLFTKTLPKVAQIAAVFIAVIALAGSVAIATSHTVRVHVMKLLYKMEEEYTTIKMVEDEEASFDVPAEWKGTSYLTYIPSSLTIFNIYNSGSHSIIQYVSIEDNQTSLCFSEIESSAEANLDTENAITEEVLIQDHVGILSTKNEQVGICWTDGHKYFVIIANGFSKEELINIANGVKRIN